MSVCVFVADIPEFRPIVEAARGIDECTVHEPDKGYWRIESPSRLEFQRKPMKFGPALWNSLLSGGFRGRIAQFDRDRLVLESES